MPNMTSLCPLFDGLSASETFAKFDRQYQRKRSFCKNLRRQAHCARKLKRLSAMSERGARPNMKPTSVRQGMRSRHIEYDLDELVIQDEEPNDIESDDLSYCVADPHVALVLDRLSKVPLVHRPSSIEKLASWLHRSGCCKARVKELVTPIALFSAIRAELEPGDDLGASIPDLGRLHGTTNIYVAAAARRTLLKLRKQSTSFSSMSMLQRVRWLYEEAYGVVEMTPLELIQELKHHNIIREHVTFQDRRILYPDTGFRWTSPQKVDRIWQVPQLKFWVKGVSYNSSYCDTTSRQSISEWLANLGCTVEFEGNKCAAKCLLESSQLGANPLQCSSKEAIQAEDHEIDLVDVVVVTLVGEEVMRKRLPRCAPTVTLRKQLEQAMIGKRARILFKERLLLDTETFEQLGSDVDILYLNVVLTEKKVTFADV